MKKVKQATKKVYANEILQNKRIYKNAKVQLRRGKVKMRCVTDKRKKYNVKFQNQTTEDKTKTENNRYLCK